MRKKLLIGFVFVLLAFGATNIFAQKAQRIKFKRGAKQAIARGNLYSYKSKKVFVIRVRRGQTLTTGQIRNESSNRYITVFITAPNGEDVNDSDASCNDRKQITPTVAGDYRIEVVECMKADPWRGSFRLKIRVE